jgi:dimethylsulfone monooxygenase
VGDPDTVAGDLKQLAEAGFDGFCFSVVAYTDELPYFIQEVLPRLERMGLRQKQRIFRLEMRQLIDSKRQHRKA